ncbi:MULTISPECIES: thiamine-phosphate kinase [unclassified Microbacterium]|uniref:thiamine-phosphate kinase n=1 Tax=unclassified Microbacterium TaxID=2609290 RepID=UPI00386740F6
MGDERVGDLSERDLLRRIFTALAGSSRALVGPGDDAAVIAAPGGRVVATTDTLVHGPDFRLAWSSGRDLGFKAAAVNLADVAAMGARPTALLVALAIPEDMTADFVSDLAAGLREACDVLAPGCAVEGGDLTVSSTLTIAVTALGVLDGVEPVLRSGARPGDVLAIAGDVGPAARGLAVLFDRFRDGDGGPVPVDGTVLSDVDRRAIAAQLRPHPPIMLGPAAAAGGATALMDVSDGLVLDATRMADASDVTIAITGITDPVALAGGEDHALLATFPTGALPAGFLPIGHVEERGAAPVTVSGRPADMRGGWDPYADWDSGRG